MITRELAKQIDDGMTVLRIGKRPTHTLTSTNVWAGLGVIGTTATAALAITNPAFGDAALQGLAAIPQDPVALLATTAVAGLACVGAYVAHRFETRWMRDGWFGDAPDKISDSTVAGLDIELTQTYRGLFGDEVAVERRDSSQYEVHVIYHDDAPIWGKLTVLARKLGIKTRAGQQGANAVPVVFIDVFDKGCSALLIPKHHTQWGAPVALDPSVLQAGKPIAHVGTSIDGLAMTVDFSLEHGVLVAGASGSGKTEVFVAIYRSLELAGVKGTRTVIDLKGTSQLYRLGADQYISKVKGESAEATLDRVLAVLKGIDDDLTERQLKYREAGCDNLWQYQRRVDANEGATILMIDELAVLSRIEDGEKRKYAMNLLASIAQLGRAGGLIWVVGMQHPLADDLPTKIRNQLMTRIVMAVADAKAAEVAGIPGAQWQPMQGGMLLKHGGEITAGRGVYLSG